MGMEDVMKWIGIIVVCLVIFAIPILETVSICIGWEADVSFILGIFCFMDFFFVMHIFSLALEAGGDE